MPGTVMHLLQLTLVRLWPYSLIKAHHHTYMYINYKEYTNITQYNTIHTAMYNTDRHSQQECHGITLLRSLRKARPKLCVSTSTPPVRGASFSAAVHTCPWSGSILQLVHLFLSLTAQLMNWFSSFSCLNVWSDAWILAFHSLSSLVVAEIPSI